MEMFYEIKELQQLSCMYEQTSNFISMIYVIFSLLYFSRLIAQPFKLKIVNRSNILSALPLQKEQKYEWVYWNAVR